MFPRYIESKRARPDMTIVLWQLADYHYELEWTGGKTKDLPETPFEDAKKALEDAWEHETYDG